MARGAVCVLWTVCSLALCQVVTSIKPEKPEERRTWQEFGKEVKKAEDTDRERNMKLRADAIRKTAGETERRLKSQKNQLARRVGEAAREKRLQERKHIAAEKETVKHIKEQAQAKVEAQREWDEKRKQTLKAREVANREWLKKQREKDANRTQAKLDIEKRKLERVRAGKTRNARRDRVVPFDKAKDDARRAAEADVRRLKAEADAQEKRLASAKAELQWMKDQRDKIEARPKFGVVKQHTPVIAPAPKQAAPAEAVTPAKSSAPVVSAAPKPEAPVEADTSAKSSAPVESSAPKPEVPIAAEATPAAL